MKRFYVWERGKRSSSQTIAAYNIYRAVEVFAGTAVFPLSSLLYMSCGTSKSNPARFISSDGTAREFTAYEMPSCD